MREAKVNAEQGFTITEDDSFYESFPYKVNWHMAKWTIPNYAENQDFPQIDITRATPQLQDPRDLFLEENAS